MIALTQIFALALLSVYKLRWALLLFIFLLAFSPRTAAISLGGEGLALTFQRVASILFILYLFVASVIKGSVRSRVSGLIGHNVLFAIVALLVLVKFTVTISNGGNKYLFYVLDDAILSIGIFLFVACYINSKQQLHNVFLAIIASVVVSGLLGVYELTLSRPLLSNFYTVTVKATDSALVGSTRDGVYRLQVFFDNPLSLAELAVYALPLSLYGFFVFKGKYKLLSLAGIAASLFLAFGSGARSALIAGSASVFVFTMVHYWWRMTVMTRFLMQFIFAVIFAFALVQAFDIIYTLGGLAEQGDFFRYDDSERSSLSRARQFFEVGAELVKSNYMGIGFRQNFAQELDELSKLDNYYLRLLLEGGVFALFLFLSALFVFYRKVIKYIRLTNNTVSRRLGAVLLSFIVGFVIMKLFVSMPGNNVYFYIMAGVYFGYMHGLKGVAKPNSKKAHIDSEKGRQFCG